MSDLEYGVHQSKLEDDVGRTPGQAALLYSDSQVVEIILAAGRDKQHFSADKVRSDLVRH